MPRKPNLTDADRAAVSQAIRHARLIETSRKAARIVKHTDPSPAEKRRRKRLESSLVEWMKHHGGDAFDRKFSDDHKRVIEKIEKAIRIGGLFALAMPRGSGKTTILKWAMLYCLLTGLRKYVIVIGATADLAQDLVEFARSQIQESDTLHKHYPHVCEYARKTQGKQIKASFQLRADGKPSGIKWSKNKLIFPDVNTEGQKIFDKRNRDTGRKVDAVSAEPYPSNGAILEGHGLTGAIRGKWKDTRTGKVIRPDFVLIDDPQTRESAESDSQCAARERIITGDVLGLAGPRRRIAAVMPCTVIRKHDLAHRFLDRELHPEWQGETCAMVIRWPTAQETLWREYGIIYRHDGLDAATAFYRARRKEMDAGGEVSWNERVRDGEISALQTAENLLLESGEQFWAEYQNDPRDILVSVYTLTERTITSRTDDSRKAGDVPEWAQTVIAATDINPSYALTTVVVAFGANQRAAVIWYGTAPLKVDAQRTDAERKAAIMAALERHGTETLARLPRPPDDWIIDGGGSPENTVVDFASVSRRICGIQAFAAFGRAAKQYRPTHRTAKSLRVYEQAHIVFVSSMQQWIIWNADYWREQAQRAWTGTLGGPGSCDLFRGNHVEFADQIVREQLAGKVELNGRMLYDWRTLPGPHDYGDCMAEAFAMAAVRGVGTGGAASRPPKKSKTISVVVNGKVASR